jgi:hypothetical protein
MRFRITFKDPDGVYDCVQSAAEGSLLEQKEALDEDEYQVLLKTRLESTQEAIKQWIQYGEYMTVEIDTKGKTCEVVPVR